jgi:two-component system response regulator MprA
LWRSSMTSLEGVGVVKLSVLVVDDNRGVRDGLAKALAVEGFQVRTADDGLSAFTEAQKHEFDAIVLDIMMPVIDGMHLYDALVAEQPAAADRVLFVSAWFDDPDVERFLRRTGRPVVAKPFDIHDIVRRVRLLAAPRAAGSAVSRRLPA